MTGMGQTTRREFLELTVATLGPLLIAQGCGDGARVPDEFAEIEFPPTQVPLPKILAAYFQGAPSKYVRAIGHAYTVPGEKAKAARDLGEELSETVYVAAEAESLEAAVARLDARIAQDFESGKIESLAGWQLSRTEIHLCSLSYILQL
jgi:hypothetical protein